jgi:hypothetical protein
MCDVPSTAVFCGKPAECFTVMAYKCFLKPFVTIPVAPFITSIIIHFRFHIRCMSTYKLSYFSLFSASFCTTFLSVGIATSIGIHVLSLLFLIIIPCLFAVTFLSVHCYYYSDIFFPVTLRPNAGHGLLILEVSRSHITMHHSP